MRKRKSEWEKSETKREEKCETKRGEKCETKMCELWFTRKKSSSHLFMTPCCECWHFQVSLLLLSLLLCASSSLSQYSVNVNCISSVKKIFSHTKVTSGILVKVTVFSWMAISSWTWSNFLKLILRRWTH